MSSFHPENKRKHNRFLTGWGDTKGNRMTENIFDQVAPDYERIHNKHLPPGVKSDSFIIQRAAHTIDWILSGLRDQDFFYLDFGCGNGRMLKCILESERLKPLLISGRLTLSGFDTSGDSLREARNLLNDPSILLYQNWAEIPETFRFDLILSCHVFHHIPPEKRSETTAFLYRKMKPGAGLVIWEQNPLNPLTRLLMKACPFDRDARLLTMNAARNLFIQHGFSFRDAAYVNLLPPQWITSHRLAAIEKKLLSFPVGAQYWIKVEKQYR